MSLPSAPHLVFRLEGVVMREAHGAPCFTPGMEVLLSELSGDFTQWLFCEDPWEEDTALASENLRLDRLIPRDRWLFSSGRFRADLPKELIIELVRRTGGRREDLLWIDDRPAVTAAVLRAGMNAVIFVDAFRLRRNLVLRGLVK
jgi:hypothetical protein